MGLKAKDIVNSAEGSAFMTRNGQNIELFYVKNVNAGVDFDVQDLKTLGRRMTGHKATGMSGSGSMTIYGITSDFAQMALDFKKNGITPYFNLKLSQEDKESTVGRQTVMLFDCLTSSIPLFDMDIDDPIIEQEVEYTFDDFDIPEKFKRPKM